MVTIKLLWVFHVFILFVSETKGNQAFYKRLVHNGDTQNCIILESEFVNKYKGFSHPEDSQELKIISRASYQSPDESYLALEDYEDSSSKVFEIWGKRKEVLEEHVKSLCRSEETVSPPLLKNSPEIIKLVDSGDQRNRIDVVFMGDGYSAEERENFFQDMNRLVKDMFEGRTFRSYLPLFNIWAIFVPSEDTGIGYYGSPKNTSFGLYREAGQLRGVFPGRPQFAREICSLVGKSGCDYPAIIANDDYYGGLGGEFVISTKSARTGTVVLRHEMGHNFVNVGEEYDNGYVYSGVNAAGSLQRLKWAHWLTNPGKVREERVTYRLMKHPWANLSEGQKTFHFYSDGSYHRWYLILSVSAAGEEDCLEFMLDGKALPWKTTGFDDREFYDWFGNKGFSRGWHNFTVRAKTPSKNEKIPRMICSVFLHEFGNEDEFHEDNNHVSAYPTWNYFRQKVYRPTNAGCLMRNMTHPELCSVCKEGMWMQFLSRISLIDSLEVEEIPLSDGSRNVVLKTLKLGQLRDPANVVEGESLKIKWFKGGLEQTHLSDVFDINAPPGNWEVQVELITPEVRKDPKGLLTEQQKFIVQP